MNRLVFVGLVALLAAGPARAQRAAVLLVCNKADDTVSFIDTRSFEVIGKATTGRGPHEVVVAPGGRWAYVANYEGGNSLSLIDVHRMKEVKKILLDPYESPHGMVIDKAGKVLYATTEGTQCLVEVDLASGKVKRRFDTAQPVTHMVAITPDEKKLYATDIGRGMVMVIDIEKGAKVKQIESGKGCEGIAITPSGDQVWATNREDDTVTIIDSKTDAVLDVIPCEGFPIRVKFTPDGKFALVSCPTKNSVAVIDTGTRTHVARIETGTAPIGVLVGPEGKRTYVANTRDNTVVMVDLEKYKVTGKVTVGGTPDGLGLAVAQP